MLWLLSTHGDAPPHGSVQTPTEFCAVPNEARFDAWTRTPVELPERRTAATSPEPPLAQTPLCSTTALGELSRRTPYVSVPLPFGVRPRMKRVPAQPPEVHRPLFGSIVSQLATIVG